MSLEHERQVKGLFDSRAASYDEYTAWRDNDRVLSEILRPLSTMKKVARCLDLGGGTGRVARKGKQIAGHWTVVDLSLGMLKAGSSGLPSINADAMSLPIKDGSFDFVAAWSSLSYMDIEHVLSEIRRVTHDDGVVVIAEKVVGGYFGVARDWYRAIQLLRNPLKIEVLETVQLAAMLSAAGFYVNSSVELRGFYRQDYGTWLSRKGVLREDVQREINNLVESRPEEVKRQGFYVEAGVLTTPVSWAICSAQRTKTHVNRPIVVTLAPVRRMGNRLEIYVQHRNAPVIAEPDFIGSFEFPQGHMELDESIDIAARRELAEEAGLSVQKVLASRYFSQMHSENYVNVEATSPELVVITGGRLQQLALFFVVEAVDGLPSAAIDNQGQWRGVEEFRAICSSGKVYPLNAPMFSHVLHELDYINAQLLPRL
jgi:ubiquinone/menaquinone biosynthesis C-methylase UbiE/8-oxo-dGTP pyrophosphatase MutT (NUDIX family)